MYSLLFVKITENGCFSNLNLYKLWKSNILLGGIMAKNIERTPTLTGDSAKEFLEDMKRPNSPKEDEIKRRIDETKLVKFL